MFDKRTRTRSEPEAPRSRSERGRTGRLLLAFVALVALGALLLGNRRRNRSSFEPPF